MQTDENSDAVAAELLAKLKLKKTVLVRVTSKADIDMAAYMVQSPSTSPLDVDLPPSGAVRIVADIKIPAYIMEPTRTRQNRKKNGLRVETTMPGGEWDERTFLSRAATVHFRMLPLKALWDLRTEVHDGVARLRGFVGKVQLARMSELVMRSGYVTTEDYCSMTSLDCQYWLGWVQGGIGGVEAKLARVRPAKAEKTA